jgi:hypothetical protein
VQSELSGVRESLVGRRCSHHDNDTASYYRYFLARGQHVDSASYYRYYTACDQHIDSCF